MEFVIFPRSYQVLEMQIFKENANFKLLFALSFCLHTKMAKRRANILGFFFKETPFHYQTDFIAADNLQQTNNFLGVCDAGVTSCDIA